MRICGWIIRLKAFKKIIIAEVSGNTSIKPYVLVFKKDEKPLLFDKARELKIGTAICFEGEKSEVQKSRRGIEYRAREIIIYSQPISPPPVDTIGKVPALLDTRIKYRYLLLRNPVEKAIFRIRASIIKAAREYLEREGFMETHTPKIVAAGAEGGATLFPVKYFEHQAYLSQSPQLYKQMLMASIPRVYEITPYFRAERFNTTRHLNESWGIDIEEGFISSEEDVMRRLESLLAHIIDHVRRNNREELEILGVEPKPLNPPFKRLRYEEVVDILRSEGIEIPEGEDLTDAAEKKLGEIMMEKGIEAYFITEFPWKTTGFYYMRKEDGYHTGKFDLDYKGLELASGGQREHRYDRLVEAIRDKGLRPESFKFYLEAFQYGMPPHGGFGLGLERLLMKTLNLDNIREAIIFVRDRTRITP